MNVAIDIRIPGKMSIEEMQFLAALARQVPAGGNIVEVGPFYGRSTHVMARSNPQANIHSIDTFVGCGMDPQLCQQLSRNPAFWP